LYGYRANEVDLKIPQTPDSTSYCIHKSLHEYDSSRRPPMSATFVKPTPAIPPKPDTTHPISQIIGVSKRMAYSPPKYNRNLRRKFRKFVRKWLRQNMTPISPTHKFDVEEWLASSNYPEWRKEQIRKACPTEPYNLEEVSHDFVHPEVNLFTKEEYYPEYKHFRGIWARSDAAKSIMGPFFRIIEQQLFKLPYFIKKIPKLDRPQYINDFMNSNLLRFQGTDYTSFESLFTTDMMDDCEFELYRYMSSMNPEAQLRCRYIFKVLASENIAKNKFFTVRVDAKRMSGEMNTSLGNGFSNLMFLLFACHYYKREFSGPIIEGDDALIGLNAPIPQEFYDKMGLNVKMEFINDISEGSFCGLVYDSEELINIRDPCEPLCTTTWVNRKYTSINLKTYYSLLRSKSLSIIYEYPGCPILYKYGLKIFNLLSEYEIKLTYENSYKYRRLLTALELYKNNNLPYKETGPRTRLLMEKMYNITVSQQLRIESEIDSMTLDDMSLPSVLEIVPDLWKTNYNNYTLKNENQTFQSLNYPNFLHYEDLKIEKIIELKRNRLTNLEKLTKAEFYSARLNKDPALYVNYCEKYKDSKKRLLINSHPLVSQADENF
jgi:hypothetical protein